MEFWPESHDETRTILCNSDQDSGIITQEFHRATQQQKKHRITIWQNTQVCDGQATTYKRAI